MPAIPYLTAQTTDGSSTAFGSSGRIITVAIAGTFDGATVTVDASPDDGATWIPSNAVFTAPLVLNVVSGPEFKHRLTVSGAGASTSLNGWISYVPSRG